MCFFLNVDLIDLTLIDSTAVTQHPCGQNKPSNERRRRSVRFADGDSLLKTAYIVNNPSKQIVKNSVIMTERSLTEPRSSVTVKGILGKIVLT